MSLSERNYLLSKGMESVREVSQAKAHQDSNKSPKISKWEIKRVKVRRRRVLAAEADDIKANEMVIINGN
jgi:hypothetical protein